MWPSPDVVIGAVLGTGGSGFIAVTWGIIKDSRARKLVNEESTIGQLRYLKEEAERDAREAREDADRRIAAANANADKRVAAANGRADRAWRIVAWYRANMPLLWAAYEKLPPPDKERFPFSPPPDLH